MRVAFSSTFVRLSGSFCVVLTSLSPLPAQIASPAVVLTVPATDDSKANSTPSSQADPSSMAGGIAENIRTQSTSKVPDIDFSGPGAVGSLRTSAHRLDEPSETISETASKGGRSCDAAMPHGVSEMPHSAVSPPSGKPGVIKSVYPSLNYVPMSCDDAFGDSDGAGQDVILGTFLRTQSGDAVRAEAGDSTDAAAPIAGRIFEPERSLPADQEPADNEPADVSERAARRSLSEIRLGDSLTQLSDSGEHLPTPESLHEGARISAPVEHHFVPAPWVGSHASRNTFQIRYQPLYFEDPNMERCGDSHGLFTEATSIAHFAGRIPLLTYMMASNSPHECVNALPDCPTCSQFGTDAYLPRPTVKAIAAQAAATVAGIYIFP
jgi:hypothetical protein